MHRLQSRAEGRPAPSGAQPPPFSAREVPSDGAVTIRVTLLSADRSVSIFVFMDVMTVLAVVVVELASLACLVGLWRGAFPLPKKVLCSLPLLVPVVGPLLYIGLPDVQPDSLQGGKTLGNLGQ